MIETSNKDSRLSVGFRCPVCKELVPFPFVTGNGKRNDYYSPSNFQRHIIRHIGKKGSQHVKHSSNTSSTSAGGIKKRQLKDKRSRHGKKQRKNDASSESEDSDADNANLARELEKNFLNESDDLAEDDMDHVEQLNDDVAVDAAVDTAAIVCDSEPGPSTRITNGRKLRKRKC